MAESTCADCKREVESGQPAVSCERCEKWWHHACVGLKAATNNKVLTHHQIVFLCLVCLDLTREEWKKKEEKKEMKDEGTQMEKKECEREERSVQTETGASTSRPTCS